MKRVHRWEIAATCGLCLAVVLGAVGNFSARCDALWQDVVRLHILANSDSAEDQALKLAVRDRLLSEAALLTANASGHDEAVAALSASLPEIERLARETVAAAGRSDPVTAEAVKMRFDTRQYEDYTLPAGVYDAIRIKIGEAKGQNWWCVLYPPLCLSAASVDELGEDGAELVRRDPKIEIRFAVVDFLSRVKEKLTGTGSF